MEVERGGRRGVKGMKVLRNRTVRRGATGSEGRGEEAGVAKRIKEGPLCNHFIGTSDRTSA